jgi:3-deoxy-7-phosphoheptulonate synthase
MSDTPLITGSPIDSRAGRVLVGGSHPTGDAVTVGGEEFVVIAGPCSVEGGEMIVETARAVREAGARMLRGGAFKPRTSPYAFQGLGEPALYMLAEARARTGLPVVTELLDVRDTEIVARHADLLQIGARNMLNVPLLAAAAGTGLPILLKRGMSSTIRELLSAAEYIAVHGNNRVILCERGIRTFETATRNTLDISAVPVLKRETHLPVIVDPSHAAGDAQYVIPLARAALAAGADGLLVEVHPMPATALSDGAQSLTIDAFAGMMRELAAIALAMGRRMSGVGSLAHISPPDATSTRLRPARSARARREG